MAKITITARGVCKPCWSEGFLPPDIPAEWKLAYFANEFSTALLSLEDLSVINAQADECWDDLPAGFRIYLELQKPDWPELPQNLLSALSGFVLLPSLQLTETVCSRLVDTAKPFARARLVEATDTDFAHDTESLPLCHRSPSGCELHCALVSPEAAVDLRQLKSHLLSWRREPIHELMVFVDAGTDFESVRNVAELARLLG